MVNYQPFGLETPSKYMHIYRERFLTTQFVIFFYSSTQLKLMSHSWSDWVNKAAVSVVSIQCVNKIKPPVGGILLQLFLLTLAMEEMKAINIKFFIFNCFLLAVQ